MCSQWVAQLGELVLLVLVTQAALKPAMPPVIKNQPFNIFWAAPTLFCKDNFDVNMNLQAFNIIPNPFETQSGSTIAVFYPKELGYYPYFSEDGISFYGGIPQNVNLSEHLRKSANDIANAVSLWRSEGLAVIDWEGWRPQWDRNWGGRIIYKNHSLAFTRHHHPDWAETKVRTVAQQEFENAGKSLMNVTLTLALEMRPKRLWGFYLYPDCYNYDYRINPEFYTGSCPDDEIFRNDQLMWLWEKSAALYPSIYLSKILKSDINALKFVHFRVREALRIAEKARKDYALPVFIFSRPFYLQSIEALSEEDLVHTIGESAALGAAGIILWGGYEYSDTKETCLSLQQTVHGLLGPYALNVTSAAKLCSQSLCNSHGRCIRKTPDSSFYLHMPEDSQKNSVTSKGVNFVISPKSKLKAIVNMKNGFVCHCYYGWHGESCRSHSPNLQKNKVPATGFNLAVSVGMALFVILMNFFLFPTTMVIFL
ncbi:similar to hyaluronoglucosaminidase 2 [Rattus norvegicus]|uniref:Hyaluronidase n=2 Tax=Rattus norvegicus TaxID=10116 RepID=A6IE90_RAT|nr:hyaluronoglucosaminidase 6 precursor [Rattus norvegicus]AAH82016.1 Hyaluronoglucosaminidase 6 [Rattus norvegicus]EDM15177.1 similar to hyaluronoglucosaminidase 2 [Rattus norvegicus]|eukprot:NP_001019491.1 hyaluronoglucosaminidase 6 precursor [Rattus norvegicus]